MISLLKEGKSPKEAKSYRPVSILSPMINLMETALLPTVMEGAVYTEHQHGFRKRRPTTSALCEIDGHIRAGLNKKTPVDRNIMVALNLRAALDTLSIDKLVCKVNEIEIDPVLKRWLKSYLHGSQAIVEFRNSQSKARKVTTGVPQGGVFSPCLFNIYMATAPLPPGDIKLVSYADDCTVLASGSIIADLEFKINQYLGTLLKWFEDNKLELSPGKSSATLFLTSSKEVSCILNIRMGGSQVSTEKHPKVLGLTFDPMYRFGKHANVIMGKVRKRNNMLSALAGSNWGKYKELFVTTYKTTGRAVMNYAAPVWSSGLAESHWLKLQRCQNAALRNAAGCLKTNMQDDLHRESKVMPVKQHCQLLSKHYLLMSQSPHRPNHGPVFQQGEREMRRALAMEHSEVVSDATELEHPKWMKRGNLVLHTRSVRQMIHAGKTNKLLNDIPSPIADEKRNLARKARTKLAQLRAGYSRMLNSYQNRLDPNVKDECPDCKKARTTLDIFSIARGSQRV